MKKAILFYAVLLLFMRAAAGQGIVVESVTRGAAGDRAGIKEGDLLLSWERQAGEPGSAEKRQGILGSPFDLWWTEKDEAPRGIITLAGKEKAFKLPPGDFMVHARPLLKDDALKLYEQGKVFLKEGKAGEAAASFDKAAELLKKEKEQACWVYYRAAQLLTQAKAYDKAAAMGAKARDLSPRTGNDTIVMLAWFVLGRAYQGGNELVKAGECFEEALAIARKIPGGDLAAAFVHNGLGILSKDRGDLRKAEEHFRQALALREALVPESLDTAASLNNLGLIIKERGDLAEAEKLYLRSVAIVEKLSPDSPLFASSLNNLGLFAYDRGNLLKAEGYYSRSLAIMERLSPDSMNAAAILTNLGALAYERGDLARAEDHHLRSLAIREKLAPGSLEVASCLNNLGVVAEDRGEYDKAEDLYKRSLAIKEKLSPGSLLVAAGLNNLGELEKARGNATEAAGYFRRSLEIREKHAPESVGAAETLLNLGALVLGGGDMAGAQEYFSRSLQMSEKIAPGGLAVSECLFSLGTLAEGRGDPGKAEELYKSSLGIKDELAPGTSGQAMVLHALGSLYRKRGDLKAALICLQKAVSALETQKTMLGGGREAKETFSSNNADVYRDLVEVEAELSLGEQAWADLERFRARSLLEMLAERDLDLSGDAPEELLQKRKELLADLGRKQGQLSGLSLEKDADRMAEIKKAIAEITREQDELREKIRRSSPKLASLQYPEPLGIDETRKLLGGKALLLSYSTGTGRTVLFALLGDELVVKAIPAGRDGLREEVKYLRRLLADPSSDRKELSARSKKLYDLILRPVSGLIGRADTVVVCPDGPLHYLPFPALLKKPSVNAISATVLKELGGAPRSSVDGTLVAFGDPDYPGSADAGAVLRSALAGGPLAPLPATEQEVRGIGTLFGGKATVLTKGNATEEKAKSVGKEVSLIHFACHGILDERFPLDSGLALSMPRSPGAGAENGLFQAWEVFEGLRIDADLVTLSACETGLGRESGGEGLIGLTRAFQYAGARAVLSSLWSVSDESTAILMKSFYSNLKKGKNKAEALRAAQDELSRSEKYRHPFYWAGFVLNGEWR